MLSALACAMAACSLAFGAPGWGEVWTCERAHEAVTTATSRAIDGPLNKGDLMAMKGRGRRGECRASVMATRKLGRYRRRSRVVSGTRGPYVAIGGRVSPPAHGVCPTHPGSHGAGAATPNHGPRARRCLAPRGALPPARGRPLQQELAIARVAGQGRGPLELGPRFGGATQHRQQVAADTRQQMI